MLLLSSLFLPSALGDSCAAWGERCGAAIKIDSFQRTDLPSADCQLEKDGFCMLNAVTPDGTPVIETDCLSTLDESCGSRLYEHLCFKVGLAEEGAAAQEPLMAVRYSNGLVSIDYGDRKGVQPGQTTCRSWTKMENFIVGRFDARQHIDAFLVLHKPTNAVALVEVAYVPQLAPCAPSDHVGCMESEDALLFTFDDYPIQACAFQYGYFHRGFFTSDKEWVGQQGAEEAPPEALGLLFGDRWGVVPIPVEAILYVDKSTEGRSAVSRRPSCAFMNIGNRAMGRSRIFDPEYIFLPSMGEKGLGGILCASDEMCRDRTWHRSAQCFYDSEQHVYGRCRVQVGFGEPCSVDRDMLCIDGLDCNDGICSPPRILLS